MMKVLSLAMALLIGFLAFEQGAAVLFAKLKPEEICCAKQCGLNNDEEEEKSSQQSPSNDCCKGKNCNPFQSCCKYVFNIQTIQNPPLIVFEIPKVLNNFPHFFFTPFNYSDSWKPPRNLNLVSFC